MGMRDELLKLVVEAGRRFKRSKEEVEPYVKTLMDNWFDGPESILEAKAEELASLGMPLRFAKELISAAGGSGPQATPDSGNSRRRESIQSHQAARSPPRKRAKETFEKNEHGEYTASVHVRRCNPEFRVKGVLIGSGGVNIKHIEKETGCKLRVHGENDEAVSVEIKSWDARQVEHAKRLAEELRKSVYDDYDEWHKERGDRGGSRHGEERRGEEHKKVVDVFECDPAFNCKGKIIGLKGQNLHHIQDQTGVRVDVHGREERGEKMYMEITGDNPRSVRSAADLCKELLDTLREEYKKWQRSGGKAKEAEEENLTTRVDVFDVVSEFSCIPKLIGKKGQNVRHIQDETGAKVWLRGDNTKGEPMFFEINASNSKALDAAESMVQDLCGSVLAEYKEWQQEGDTAECFQQEVPVPKWAYEFHGKGKLIGAKGRNLNHIRDESGAQVWIRGDEWGDEPMFVEIKASTAEGAEKAAGMIQDLIGTVQEDYDEWEKKSGGSGRRRNRNKQDTVGEEGDAFKDTIPVFECDPDFKVKGAIIGTKGRNLKHIQDETGSKIRVEGEADAGEKISIEITATSQESLDEAKGMLHDLLSTLEESYREWLEAREAEESATDKDDKGTGKGRGKSWNTGDFTDTVNVFVCADPEGFGLRTKIAGKQQANLKHIQEQTNTSILLLGEGNSNDPMRLEIAADSADELDAAVEMANDLVNAIHVMYKRTSKGQGNRRSREDVADPPPTKRVGV